MECAVDVSPPEIVDLGRMSYEAAYEAQLRCHAEVLAAREAGSPEAGRVLVVEHDPPVITVSRRPGARAHLVATEAQLAAAGVVVRETDRGGDITYHGPGQVVVYPILDLNVVGLRLHGYMRFLEQAVIDACRGWGVEVGRDSCATGVWVGSSKVCALGVRVRRWITMHGIAVNVRTDLSHFDLIVPCGLAGRGVTSLERELGASCPTVETVKAVVGGGIAGGAAKLAAERGSAAC